MNRHRNALASAGVLMALVAGSALAHHPEHVEAVSDGDRAKNRHLLHVHDSDITDGHVLPNVNYGFEVVGRDLLGGVADGKYTDVWAHKGFAYVGTFQEPTCDRSGVFVSDIRDPTNPTTVASIKSPPGTRINDVKVHTVGAKDVLIFTLEPCGPLVGNGTPQGNGNGGHQQGQGGISLWDVTKPAKPHALKQNFLDFPVHNTFPWTTADGKTYLLIVDDVNIDDVHIADISKPQTPKLISTTGIGTWLLAGQAPQVGADGQLFTGSFAAPLLHDIWVEQMPNTPDHSGVLHDNAGKWVAVLSYWDAGFITLDVSDPANPLFIADSTYPDPDPVHDITPAEGNAHAAVFGGAGTELIFGGDEDFDSLFTAVSAGGEAYPATQGSDVPQVGPGADVESLTGPTVYVGLACNAVPAAPSADAIAVIQRGACAFTTKAGSVEAAGYSAGVVFNHATGCDASVSMLVQAGIPMLFVPRSSGFGILGIAGYDAGTCNGSGADNGDALLATFGEGGSGLLADIGAVFDGWGYLHVLNNLPGDVTVKYGNGGDTRTVGYLGEIGYYAPSEVSDPALATGAGDLTMHNLEVDPSLRTRAFISWYSLGMRAVEFRQGHLHTNAMGEGVNSWNVHEVGRFIAEDGSNFWGVHVTEVGGEQYVLGSDRNTGLWIFRFTCVGEQADNPALYCIAP